MFSAQLLLQHTIYASDDNKQERGVTLEGWCDMCAIRRLGGWGPHNFWRGTYCAQVVGGKLLGLIYVWG